MNSNCYELSDVEMPHDPAHTVPVVISNPSISFNNHKSNFELSSKAFCSNL
jgi:hypothetical protein